MVEMTNVRSSNIKAVGYNVATQDCYVQFSSNVVYRYAEVPEDYYNKVISSPSAGKALNELIKNGGFSFTKLNSTEVAKETRVQQVKSDVTDKPEMIEVQSSNVAAIGYKESQRELYVNFNNGGQYVYFNVPLTTFNAMKSAKSVGSFLFSEIKKVGYKYEKVN